MLQLHGMKVLILTTGGLTDVLKYFRCTANNRREKSADVIVGGCMIARETELSSIEGQNFNSV